jgi:UDP-glucose 4-epimerase
VTTRSGPDIPHADRLRGAGVLVTGGAGFIGGHLSRRLVDLGARVRVLDDLSSGFRHNVPADAELLVGSVTDDDAVRAATAGCSIVFHEAAMVSVPESVDAPQRCYAVNVTGTLAVLEAARAAGVERLVFASSAAVYGDDPSLPSGESDPVRCVSPYAASKAAGEALLAAWSRSYGLPAVALRYFNVYGPGQNPKSAYAAAIAAFVAAVAREAEPTIFGDGLQTRDFVHVDDVVRANLLAATCADPPIDRACNIGTGQAISLLQVLTDLGRAVGRSVTPRFAPPRAGDVRHSVADIRRAAATLGYEPQVAFADGIRDLAR